MSKKSFVNHQYEIYKAKNALYGDSFLHSLQKYGNSAFAVRVSDKIERLRQLLSNKDFTKELNIVNDEKIDDTVRDLFNYVSMFYALTHKIEVNEAMEYMTGNSIRMLSILAMKYGQYNQSILDPLNPEDIALFAKIEKILKYLMD